MGVPWAPGGVERFAGGVWSASPYAPGALSSVVGDPATPVSRAPGFELGAFPEYPRDPVPEPVADAFQAALDEAVAERTIRGATAAVVVAGTGSWAGAAGVDRRGSPLTAATRLRTAQVANTVVAAQVLRLVEEGVIGLDDPAADLLPPEAGSFDPNGSTIRDLLGMRSGLPGSTWADMLGPGAPIAELVAAIPPPLAPAGLVIQYAPVNYALLLAIIEHVTGRPWPQVLGDGVVAGLGRDGLAPSASPPFDGRTDAETLARWGYDLYGGYVLADSSLREMIDFRGDFYGLGTIDFSHPRGQFGHAGPAVGHDGSLMSRPVGTTQVVRLVVFPDSGVVVSVQANAGGFHQIQPLVEELRDAAQL